MNFEAPVKHATLTCVAHGHGREWEAFCLDFDLAVQGISRADVRDRLEDAIQDYVQAALAEDEPARSQLLSRRAPLLTRLYWALRFYMPDILSKTLNGDSVERFPVACHA